jgi:hypothetical protein
MLNEAVLKCGRFHRAQMPARNAISNDLQANLGSASSLATQRRRDLLPLQSLTSAILVFRLAFRVQTCDRDEMMGEPAQHPLELQANQMVSALYELGVPTPRLR